MTTTTQTPGYHTVAELSARFRLSRMTIYRLIHSGELPAHRFGRTFRADDADVQAFIEASKVDAR